MAAYSMGKAAINHFTLNLAAELGKRGITVNAIGPGLTATDFTAHARQDPRSCSKSRPIRRGPARRAGQILPAWRHGWPRTMPAG